MGGVLYTYAVAVPHGREGHPLPSILIPMQLVSAACCKLLFCCLATLQRQL